MEKNGQQPAFPTFQVDEHGDIKCNEGGLTKREYFAAMAMQGIVNACWQSRGEFNVPYDELIICKYSTDIADALLTQLNTPDR